MKLLTIISFIGIIYLCEGRYAPNVQQYGRNQLKDAHNYNEKKQASPEYRQRYPETYNENPEHDQLPAAAYPSDMQPQEEENARIYETPNEGQQADPEENIREGIENERLPAAALPSNVQHEDSIRNAALPSNIQPAGLRNVEFANNEPNDAKRDIETEGVDEEAEYRAMADEEEDEMDEEEMVEEIAGRMMKWWQIFPGTNWCGAGNRADDYNDLGRYRGTDACCREHDHCPNTIPKRTTKWGLKNRLWFTMSECSCDKKFLDCLNRVNKWSSRTVKNVYFFFMPCFNLNNGKATRSRIRR